MSTTRLFAHTPEGPQPLALPDAGGDVNALLDALPLGIYEGMRTFEQVRFLGLGRHLARAERAAEELGWGQVFEPAALRRSIDAVVRDSPPGEYRLRFDVLAGPATALGTASRVLLARAPLTPVPAALLAEGVACPLVRDLRREQPHLKGAAFVITRRRYPVGAAEAYEPIMVDDAGYLREGVSAGFAMVRAGGVCTAGSGVLPSITLELVGECAAELGVPVRWQAVHERDLGALDEAFLATSVRGLVPITRLGAQVLGDGRPGPITRALMDAYASKCAREARPALAAE
ncbi:aminotransferase class IV [Haliangium ochraceum]|uniref:branched-chain-amino-acid transaminase n=1 Tax=Haliangium ochraceum (strain DSM 14365 / JCM 11303 / SMP-2) TaxID=502025 RepID=D0LW53_HALO1|nr:aminotransferase class IV [Haliangium ochraceum]ACY15985.1 aminotransferase class IV [Haliangium ochraceum DSM 14365]